MKNFNHKVPGLLLSLAVSILAIYTDKWLGWLGTAGWAIGIGLLLSKWANHRLLNPGLAYAEKNILQLAIALLGAQLAMTQIHQIGQWLLPLLITTLFLWALGAWILPKWGISAKMAWLLASGEAVCGSAAIGSVNGVIKAKPEETGLAIVLVNLFSTLGLFLIPLALLTFDFDPSTSAWFTGAYLQSAGHAIAAGGIMGEEVLPMATALKMARIAFLIPLLLISQFLFKRTDSTSPKTRWQLPAFLYVFIALALLFNTIPAIQPLKAPIEMASKYSLHWALAALGMRIQLKGIAKTGLAGLKAGFILAIFHLLLMVLLWALWPNH